MNTYSNHEWKKFFKSRGIKEELIEEYLKYISLLNRNKVPIIFEIEHFSYLTGIKLELLYKMIYGSSCFYRTFYIEKKSSFDFREITVPYPSLKSIQDWINKNILSTLKVHYNAHGYVKNKSIKTNAQKHINQKELYKIDLKDFFPSIGIERIINQFKILGYSKNVSFYLASLCCYNGKLTQGSPTSPTLSNAVTFKLDKRLTSLAKKNNLIYTRYVDDIGISGENIHYNLQKLFLEIIKDEGFIVNHKKTYLNKETSNKRILAGVSIQEEKLTIPRKMKRKLKQEVYFVSKYGIKSHMLNIKNKSPYYYESLLGKLKYWNYIETNSTEAQILIKKLEESRT